LNPEGNNVFLTFDPNQDHVFSTKGTKVENHRKHFFDPMQANKQTSKQANAFIFFHNTLPTVDGNMLISIEQYLVFILRMILNGDG
jgi:hypothetical protein